MHIVKQSTKSPARNDRSSDRPTRTATIPVTPPAPQTIPVQHEEHTPPSVPDNRRVEVYNNILSNLATIPEKVLERRNALRPDRIAEANKKHEFKQQSGARLKDKARFIPELTKIPEATNLKGRLERSNAVTSRRSAREEEPLQGFDFAIPTERLIERTVMPSRSTPNAAEQTNAAGRPKSAYQAVLAKASAECSDELKPQVEKFQALNNIIDFLNLPKKNFTTNYDNLSKDDQKIINLFILEPQRTIEIAFQQAGSKITDKNKEQYNRIKENIKKAFFHELTSGSEDKVKNRLNVITIIISQAELGQNDPREKFKKQVKDKHNSFIKILCEHNSKSDLAKFVAKENSDRPAVAPEQSASSEVPGAGRSDTPVDRKGKREIPGSSSRSAPPPDTPAAEQRTTRKILSDAIESAKKIGVGTSYLELLNEEKQKSPAAISYLANHETLVNMISALKDNAYSPSANDEPLLRIMRDADKISDILKKTGDAIITDPKTKTQFIIREGSLAAALDRDLTEIVSGDKEACKKLYERIRTIAKSHYSTDVAVTKESIDETRAIRGSFVNFLIEQYPESNFAKYRLTQQRV